MSARAGILSCGDDAVARACSLEWFSLPILLVASDDRSPALRSSITPLIAPPRSMANSTRSGARYRRLSANYLRSIGTFDGVSVGGDGEIANVSHAFQPEARCSAANSR